MQRGHRSVDLAEIRDFSNALEIDRVHLFKWRKDRGHCYVDPDVDGTEGLFDLVGGGLYLLRIGYIRRYHESFPPGLLDIVTGSL
jgi:hypothetical protein